MKTKRFISGLLISSALLLVGCSESEENNHFVQVKTSDVDRLMTGKENGFLLVVKEPDGEFEGYVSKITKIANQKELPVKMYNTFQPTGKEFVERDSFKYTSTLKGERLYAIENGAIIDELNVNSLEKDEFKEEIERFIDDNS